MRATTLALRAVCKSASEDRQTGGGCVGGLMTCSRNASINENSGTASAICGSDTFAGKIAPKTLMHLIAHEVELL
jgi:hypothetical protein